MAMLGKEGADVVAVGVVGAVDGSGAVKNDQRRQPGQDPSPTEGSGRRPRRRRRQIVKVQGSRRVRASFAERL